MSVYYASTNVTILASIFESAHHRYLIFLFRENDVLYGGRGRRHFHRVANQRFLELVKMSRKEYLESRCKKAVAKRIVKEWKEQTPPGRFLQQDPKTEKWYEISESKIMEKTCQALRDMKRERGPAGVKHGISDRMVDPWDGTGQQQLMNGPMHHQRLNNGPMPPGQTLPHPPPPPGHHHHHPYGHPPPGAPWMGQPSMYPPPQPMMQGGSGGGGQMMPPQMPPYVPMPPQPMPVGTAAGMGQGSPTNSMPVENGNVTQTEVAAQEMDARKQGDEKPVEAFQPVDEQPIAPMEMQPSSELKGEVDQPKEMQVEEMPPPPPQPPQDVAASVSKGSPTPVETAAAEVAAAMPIEAEAEAANDVKPQEKEPEVAVDEIVHAEDTVPLPIEESAPSEPVVPVPETDTPSEVTESKEEAESNDSMNAEAPAK